MDERRNEPYDDLLDRATEALRRVSPPPGPLPAAAARLREAIREAEAVPISHSIYERAKKMKRIAQIAIAATSLVALGTASWLVVGGGSTNLALAKVADVLDSLRSATFDMTSEIKAEKGQPSVTATAKGFFLAPSHHRVEVSVLNTTNMITISDSQTAKSVMLMPAMKLAIVADLKQRMQELKKSAKGAPPDLFEIVRRVVREGSNDTGEKVEGLGEKEMDGHVLVGFRTHNVLGDMPGDMTIWADPETAQPVRVEFDTQVFPDIHMVMSNFHYDVALEPSLFSLEPPEGYATQSQQYTVATEEDLLRTLRTVAENNKGAFPAKLALNQEFTASAMAAIVRKIGGPPSMDKISEKKLKAAMDKVAAKYGGEERLREKYGKDKQLPPDIMAEMTKATQAIMQKPMQQKQMQEWMHKYMPLMQKESQGMMFYTELKPENDAHYTGGGVKLGTPDRPILWYKPTGAEKYRVIYADLSVKEMDADSVKGLSAAGRE